MKHKAEDVDSYEIRKKRTLNPMKHKANDVESYGTKNKECGVL